MEKTSFIILECNAVKELFFLFELIEKIDYKKSKRGNVDVFVVFLKTDRARLMYEMIKDMSIYLSEKEIYLEDYLFLKLVPTESILNYINFFKSDHFFLPYVSQQAVVKFSKKLNIRI